MNCGDSGPCARFRCGKEAVSADCVNLECCVYTKLDLGNIPDSVHVDCTTQESLILVSGKVELAA